MLAAKKGAAGLASGIPGIRGGDHDVSGLRKAAVVNTIRRTDKNDGGDA